MTKPLLTTPQQVLTAARYVVQSKLMPYFALSVQNCIPVWCPGLGSIAISEGMHLLIDPAIWVEWYKAHGIETCGWVLIHEVNHVLRGHADRTRKLGVGPENLGTANTCKDWEINDDIPDARDNLPTGYCCLPADGGQERGKMWEQYYLSLPTRIDVHPTANADGSQRAPEDGGTCGSGSTGVPIPQEAGLPGAKAPDGTPIPQGRSKADVRRIQQGTAKAIQDHAAGRGDVPEGIARWASEQLRPATIPWQELLRSAGRDCIASVAGHVDYSYDRPSRRQAGVGFGVGFPVMPRMVTPIPDILIAIDTSGSMSEKALVAALGEVNGVLQGHRATVTVCSCDAAVHTLTRVTSIADAAKALVGGGGTDFRPVFEKIAGMTKKPHALFFFTDGDGIAPPTAPPGYSVTWCLVDGHGPAVMPYDGQGNDVAYGKVIKIPSLEDKPAE